MAVREALAGRVLEGVVGSDATACIVEGTELDRHASADTDEWGEGPLVEGEGAFGFIYLGSGVQSAGVFGGGLETDFNDICFAPRSMIATNTNCESWQGTVPNG